MKTFLKMTLATLFGLFLFCFFSLFIFAGIISVAGSAINEKVVIKPQTVFHLKLSGTLSERSNNIYSLSNNFLGYEIVDIGLDDVLNCINKAATNENIAGIYLECGALSVAPASIQEIRDALIRFKQSGKFLIAYADSYTQECYQIASIANHIYLNPQGIVEWKGLSMQNVFYKDLLDKIGVEMQVVKVGTFKSAVEPYIRTNMSEANKLQLTQLANALWNNALENVSDARNISKKDLQTFANEGLMLAGAKKAVEFKLIDSLVYKADVKPIIEKFTKKDYETCSLKQLKNVAETNTDYKKEKLAIVYAYGAIDGQKTSDNIDSEETVKTLNKIAKDENIKAVVFRVNSPGGSAFGSEQIWNAVQNLKAQKPVIVSMGDYAASGGYYISCCADTIVAQPNTITGSIGIFGLIPNTKELMKKIGLSFDIVKTNTYSDFGASNRALNKDEQFLLQNHINNGYELFVKRCSDGRNMTTEQIKSVAEGRVWSGTDAQKIGLVDVIGGLDEAVQIAAKKASLTSYRKVCYPEKKDIITQLIEDLYSEIETKILVSRFGEEARLLQLASELKNSNKIQARLPFWFEIK